MIMVELGGLETLCGTSSLVTFPSLFDSQMVVVSFLQTHE